MCLLLSPLGIVKHIPLNGEDVFHCLTLQADRMETKEGSHAFYVIRLNVHNNRPGISLCLCYEGNLSPDAKSLCQKREQLVSTALKQNLVNLL